MTKSKIYITLFFLFFIKNILSFSSHEASLKTQISPSSIGYSYGILQYNGYWKSNDKSRQIIWAYDTDAFSTQHRWLWENYFFSLGGKAHLFDWQNLEFIIDEGTGKRDKSKELVAPYGETYISGGYKFDSSNFSTLVSLNTGISSAKFSSRDKEASVLSIEKQPLWIKNTINIGLSKGAYSTFQKSYGINGAFQLSYLYSIEQYKILENQNNFAEGRKNILELSYRFLYSWQNFLLTGILFNFETRGRWLDSAFSSAKNLTRDLAMEFSVGGSEKNYGRLAGFSFSEYRVTGFQLFNLDFFIPLFYSLDLWLVSDWAYLDKKIHSSHFHTGAGIGFYYHFVNIEKSFQYALFLRLDMALTVNRTQWEEKLQLYLGSSFQF